LANTTAQTYLAHLEPLTGSIPLDYTKSDYSLLNELGIEGIFDIIDRINRYAPQYMDLFHTEEISNTSHAHLWNITSTSAKCKLLDINQEVLLDDQTSITSTYRSDIGINFTDVIRNDVTCQRVSSALRHKYGNSKSIHYLTEYDPGYYVERGELNVLPGDSTGLIEYKLLAVDPSIMSKTFHVSNNMYQSNFDADGKRMHELPLRFRRALLLYMAMQLVRQKMFNLRGEILTDYTELDDLLEKINETFDNMDSETKLAKQFKQESNITIMDKMKESLNEAKNYLDDSNSPKDVQYWLDDEDTDMVSSVISASSAFRDQFNSVGALFDKFHAQASKYNELATGHTQTFSQLVLAVENKLRTGERIMSDLAMLKQEYLQFFIDSDFPPQQQGGN
tara:strand:+ start:349 stop:1527 length:1179 start_codon:yes stop_codon:yes gene_type:complete